VSTVAPRSGLFLAAAVVANRKLGERSLGPQVMGDSSLERSPPGGPEGRAPEEAVSWCQGGCEGRLLMGSRLREAVS
jgi:hypothetical protein